MVLSPSISSIGSESPLKNPKSLTNRGINLILFFCIIFSFIWIILYSLDFIPFLRYNNNKNFGVDPASCFIASLIVSFIILLFIWLFQICKT